MYDIIIIGGGPAGMTAALYALRSNKTVLVIEKAGFGGQITSSPKVENYPGTLSMSGNEFADSLLEQIIAQDADVELETVTSIEDGDHIKRVFTEEGSSYDAKSVIIAVGVKHRMLGLERENEFVGSGISFCAVCDGGFYSGQTVVVAGGGNSALQEALLLADICREVIVVQDLAFLTGEERLRESLLKRPNVRALTGTVIKELLIAEDKLKGVVIRSSAGDIDTIECDGLFVAVGLIPENEAFSNVISLDERGYIDSGENCLTGRYGVFTAGDCRSKTVRQLTTACADGAVAALAACKYIDGRN